MLSYYITLGKLYEGNGISPMMNANSFEELRGALPNEDQFKEFIIAANTWFTKKKQMEELKKEFTSQCPFFKIELGEDLWKTFSREVRRKSSTKMPSDAIQEVYLLGGDSRFMIGRITKKKEENK